ncbi:hypothetical protein PCASD_16261 [Puccinia coronata f. sp. avenae]|uniref:RING-type domain-containing protein n=1 Tax=Puccinia coronata f. sp. avenae TaxID=200324 RepID=A0A2N5TPX8_9BASI|nr:hypothetical protein PCASD_16261 [Puccinia coronata f. sp. avenae]
MSSPGLIRGPGNESSTETTLTSRDTRPDQNSIVSLDAVAAAVADARRALRELHEQTSTLELITSQLHRHAVLLQLIQTALALNLEQGGEASTHQESTQRQVSVDSLSPGLHTLAIVRSYNTNSDNQSLHCLICLEDYIKGCPIIVLPCHESHNFHVACLANWSRHCQQLTCPLCRSPFEPRSSNDRLLEA